MSTFPEATEGIVLKRRIIARSLLLGLFALALVGCSMLRLAYSQGPSLAYWWIDGYADLNDAQLWELLRISRWYRVPQGTVLVQEGAPAKSCYLLLEGSAKVTQQGKLINWLDGGTLFGELAFADKEPGQRAATVTAAAEVVVGKWPYASLRQASPELQSRMLQIFFRLAAERLKKADEQYLLIYHQHLKAQGNISL